MKALRLPAGACLVSLALLSYLLHTRLLVECIISTITLTVYGVFLLQPETTPLNNQKSGAVIEITWIFLFVLPVCVHNVSAISSLQSSTAASILGGSLVLAMPICLVAVSELKKNPYCRHPQTFIAVAVYASICVVCKSWFAVLILFPTHCFFLIEVTGGMRCTQQQADLDFLGEVDYIKYRGNTSACLPLPSRLYRAVPSFFKESVLFEKY